MPALSTFAKLTGDREADAKRLAADSARYWPSAGMSLDEARAEVAEAYVMIAEAPTVAEADAAEDAAFGALFRSPRDKRLRDAHDEAKRRRLAAWAKERLEAGE
jgi:hypothetical protein